MALTVVILSVVIAILVVGIYPAFISDVFSRGLEPIVDALGNSAQAGLAQVVAR